MVPVVMIAYITILLVFIQDFLQGRYFCTLVHLECQRSLMYLPKLPIHLLLPSFSTEVYKPIKPECPKASSLRAVGQFPLMLNLEWDKLHATTGEPGT